MGSGVGEAAVGVAVGIVLVRRWRFEGGGPVWMACVCKEAFRLQKGGGIGVKTAAWVVCMGGEGVVGGGGWAVCGSRGYRVGWGGVCRVGGSVGQVRVVRVACRTGSQRKELSGISPDEGWSASLRLLVLVDTRHQTTRSAREGRSLLDGV